MKDEPHKKSLLQRWKNREKSTTKSSVVDIGKSPKNASIPLSHGQQRLWFLEQLYPGNPVYNFSEVYHFKGALQFEYIQKGIQKILDDNDVLRTFFEFDDQKVTQRVKDEAGLEIPVFDLSKLPDTEQEARKGEILYKDARKSFDLTIAPLVRALLIKLTDSNWILFVTMHHIVTDKWSMGIFREQLAAHYASLCAGVPMISKRAELQFADYAYWQKDREADQTQLNYWKEKLGGKIPYLELPTDFKMPKSPSFSGASYGGEFSAQLSKKLLDLAVKLETTPYVLLLSVHYLLLFRYTGQADLLVGSPISNRSEKVIEDLIGFFDETIVLRTQLQPDMLFEDLVRATKETVLNAFSNKDIPFDVLVQELKPKRSLGTNPFFRSMFIYHDVPPTPSFDQDIALSYSFFDSGVSKFDLTLYVAQDNGILAPSFEYSTTLFNESTITQFYKHLELLCQGLVTNPDVSLSQIPMLTSEERSLFSFQSAETNRPFDVFNGIHEVIENIAHERPNATALTFEKNTLTYAELNSRANALAHTLVRHTKGRNQIIGLCAERSIELIVGLVAILKSGCAYLPLDPEYPEERIDFMLADSAVEVMVTQDELVGGFKNFNGKIETLSPNTPTLSNEGEAQLPVVKPTDLAYVIYTSGSTGNPKGVPIRHKNILASTEGRLNFYPKNPKAFLLMSSIAFDSSKAGLYWTLCTGGNLVISEKRLEQDIKKLSEVIASNEISHSLMLPSLYELLLEHADLSLLRSLSAVIVAGEACPASLREKHFQQLPEVSFYNEYGPTEATVWCIAHQIKQNNLNAAIPIGKPVANAAVYLLNNHLTMVPRGATGEIYIGGPGLSGSYLNRPELTEAAYIDNPFDDKSGAKLYKTGDLGRYNKDGHIEFLGRADHQVKLRGYRIELDEIENKLRSEVTIKEAVVLLSKPESQGSSSQSSAPVQLLAFVIASELFDEASSKESLRSSLPAYMVPHSIIQVDQMPILPNGKVDRTALGKYRVAEREILDSDLPKTEVEGKLVAIWEEVLNLSPIGINDNFFTIGGDSITSIQIIAKARNLGIEIKASQLFDSQTIAELALFAQEKQESRVENEQVTGQVLLTPIQHWFFENHRNAPHYWNNAVKINGDQLPSSSHFEKVTMALITYHDGLRLSFKKGESWEAEILGVSDSKGYFIYQDLSGVVKIGDQNDEIIRIFRAIQEETNLSRGKLFKTLYVNCGALQAPKVFLIAHHLVIDIVSWNTLFSDFEIGLKQSEQNIPIRFKQKTSSIKLWGTKLKELSSDKVILNELPYWQDQKIANVSFPVDFESELELFEDRNVALYQNQLDLETSSALLLKANDAYNTKVEDLLLSALYLTFKEWADLDTFSIGLERHGRSSEAFALDVSNTIGWFTAFFPIALEGGKSNDMETTIKKIKEKLRSIPNDGIGYGILRYLSEDEVVSESLKHEPQLIFNYIGVQNDSSEENYLNFEQLWKDVRHPKSERTYPLEINTFVANKLLQINWSYSIDIYKEATIRYLVTNFEKKLKEVIDHCLEKGDTAYTPSDFPEADLSQGDLDELMRRLNS